MASCNVDDNVDDILQPSDCLVKKYCQNAH